VRGGAALVARRSERLIHHAGRGWDVLWPAGLGPLSPPAETDKYSVQVGDGPVVSGHPTRMIEVRQGAMLRERLLVAPDNGLLVGRTQYDAGGAVRRSVVFQSLGAYRGQPLVPRSRAPRHQMSPTGPAVAGMPAVLPEGYRRIGAYRRGDVVHVVYSDGLYGLSVFEQPGRLRANSLPPGGRPVPMGRRGRWFEWPGGNVAVWSRGPDVVTAVGDGPAEEVMAAAEALKATRLPEGPIDRLRDACRSLIQGFGTP
jgi:hypothetical protein